MLYERSSHPTDNGAFAGNQVAGGIFDAWNKENTTFSSMALVQENQVGLSASGDQLPERLNSANVSWTLFPTLGVNPALGRGFISADDSPTASGTAILSWSLWQRRFGGDHGILDRTIYLEAKPYTVIGVMPAWFAFPYSNTQVWTPIYHEMPEGIIAANPGFLLTGRTAYRLSCARRSNGAQPHASRTCSLIVVSLPKARLAAWLASSGGKPLSSCSSSSSSRSDLISLSRSVSSFFNCHHHLISNLLRCVLEPAALSRHPQHLNPHLGRAESANRR